MDEYDQEQQKFCQLTVTETVTRTIQYCQSTSQLGFQSGNSWSESEQFRKVSTTKFCSSTELEEGEIRDSPENKSKSNSKPYRVEEKFDETPKRTNPPKKRARRCWSSSSSSCSSEYSSGSTSSEEDRLKRRKRRRERKPKEFSERYCNRSYPKYSRSSNSSGSRKHSSPRMISPENSERKPKEFSQRYCNRFNPKYSRSPNSSGSGKYSSSPKFSSGNSGPSPLIRVQCKDKSQKHQDHRAFQSNLFSQENALATSKAQSNANFLGQPESRGFLYKFQKHQDQSAFQSNHVSQEPTLATSSAQSSANFSGEPFGPESRDILDKSQKDQDQSALQSNHFSQETTLATPNAQSSVNFNFSGQTFGQELCSSSYSNDAAQSSFHSTNVQFANESWRPPNLNIRPNLYITPPTIPISNNFVQFSGKKKFSLPWHSSYQPGVKTLRAEKTIPDYLRSAFGFKPDDNEELTNAFKIMMPQIKEIFVGTIAKTYIGDRAVAFQIADIVNLGGKVWRNLTKNKKLEHPKWPFLVDKRDVTNPRYYPIELTYTEK